MTQDAVVMFEGTVYEEGYGLIAKKVMRDRGIHPKAKTIYAYLCSFAGPSGKADAEREAFPGVSLMMDELGIKSEDTFYKYRKQLVDKGYIKIEKRRKEGSKFESNLYKIVAVPVEIPAEKPAEVQEKKPHPKKSGMEKPYPNFSSTENPSTENQGTIITSSIITSSTNLEEEEYIVRTSEDNIAYEILKDELTTKEIDQETIKNIIGQLQEYGIELFEMQNVEKQFVHMMDKQLAGERIYDFAFYFAKGLKDLTLQSKATKQYQKEKLAEYAITQQNRPKVAFYNWLEER